MCVCDCVEQTFELKVLNLNRAQLTRFSTQLGAACASFVCWPEKEERERVHLTTTVSRRGRVDRHLLRQLFKSGIAFALLEKLL